MNQPFTRKIIIYSSLFITVALNSPRLFALRKDGFFARLVPFDWAEWAIQMLINFLFCLTVFYYNRKNVKHYFTSFNTKLHGKLLFINFCMIIGFAGLGAIISRQFFKHGVLPGAGYFTRITLSFILIVIIFRVITAIYNAQVKERENQQLRNDNLQMELELLKSQLNPHFFFNALSSLSGIVREDPRKAQLYIGHLSKIFRYTLNRSGKDLVTVQDELEDIYSYTALLKMRYEEGVEVVININDALLQRQIPAMSMQPLVENAIKHNTIASDKPLRLLLEAKGDVLEISNNLQPSAFPQVVSGIGLANLAERFKILLHKEIEIIKTDTTFIVKLPLK